MAFAPLTPSQIRYAFDDVRYLLPVWKRLQDRLVQLDRLDWAREEFERLCDHATPEACAFGRYDGREMATSQRHRHAG